MRDDQPVALTPKCFDLLIALVENGGHLMAKETLLEKLWPNQFVEEGNLSVNISALRKALGEGRNGEHYIETVPKKGFRFVAPVTFHQAGAGGVVVDEATNHDAPEVIAGATSDEAKSVSSSSWWADHKLKIAALLALVIVGVVLALYLSRRNSATAVNAPLKTLAVLPFKPVSNESRDESLEMGMAETLVTRLSNVRQIAVRPMSAIRDLAGSQTDPIEVGKQLSTEAVLDGSIQKSGDRLRVTVRLTNVKNGQTLWTEQFDESFTDIFKVQDSIANRVTNSLVLKLSSLEQDQLAKRYTNNPEAYSLFLQANHLRNKREFNKSLEFHQRTIEKDPNFALAYVGMAQCYILLTNQGKPNLPHQVAGPKAKEAVNKALALDDSLPEAHSTRAELEYQFDYDWVEAEKDFQKAIELNPNSAQIRLGYGWFLMMAARFNEALPEMERAQELEPGNMRYQLPIGVLFFFSREYDKAIARFQKILEVEQDPPGVYFWLANIYQNKQMYRETVDYSMKQALKFGGARPEDVEECRKIFEQWGWRAFLLAVRERRDKYPGIQPINTRSRAVTCILLGENDKALEWINKAIDEHDPFAVQLKVDPNFDSLRSDPRFVAALRRLNLTP